MPGRVFEANNFRHMTTQPTLAPTIFSCGLCMSATYARMLCMYSVYSSSLCIQCMYSLSGSNAYNVFTVCIYCCLLLLCSGSDWTGVCGAGHYTMDITAQHSTLTHISPHCKLSQMRCRLQSCRVFVLGVVIPRALTVDSHVQQHTLNNSRLGAVLTDIFTKFKPFY